MISRSLLEVSPLAAPEPPVSGRQLRQKQQLDFLLKRQLQFKEAAITAKKKGDMTAAKKFLLAAKVSLTFYSEACKLEIILLLIISEHISNTKVVLEINF